MRIALFPDDYLPDSTLVHAKMFHELALELKRMGHQVVVITPSHGKQNSRLIKETIDGVDVWRFRNPAMRGNGNLRRVISECLLSINAYLATKNEMRAVKFDACINYSPTIFFGPLMHWMRRFNGAYIYLILRDMFPQWIVDEGLISRNSPITFFFRAFEKINYSASHCIGLMSGANIKYFREVNPDKYNLQVLRNWSKTAPSSYDSYSINIRDAYSLQDKVIFFYGGNIGHAQDISNLLRLAEAMMSYPKAHFLFIGQGDQVELVIEAKKEKNLTNLTFLPSINQEKYKQVLTQVDIGLFSLAKTHKAHNFPGKLLGYMLQSLPILGSVNEGNDLIEFINAENAGFAFVNGQDAELKNAALALLEDKCLRSRCSRKSKKLLDKYFSVYSAATQLIETIEQKGNI
ncbi:glycosyltransferase family 4 protein [Vibrio caribbeanicus]|uniref:glycosyltransferase family 4 protein n=1 Tax=Vibrio caribbeanicus TaxID=701175 RepID=UPI0022839A9D|nr:glycosyltransferase family 4 protein [Vibrio caribbeanicus]